jgi:xylulokinase
MYLGLDLGTSGLRALLMDADQRVIGAGEAACTVAHPHRGWSEQDPADWIRVCEQAVANLKREFPAELAAVRAIGLSGHMHGATLLDARDAVLRPAMLWNDTRASEQAERLDATRMFRDKTGNIVFPGFTAPKVEWVRENEPEIFGKIAKILLPKDYLRLWLTGEFGSDMSDSAGTSWLDTGRRDWSPELLAACRLDVGQMPQLVEGSQVGGQLRAQLCADWGMHGEVKVVGGGGDNAAAACGVGCLSGGQGFVSLGTSGVLLAARDSYAPDPDTAVHTFCHAVPETWYQMGVILSATDSLNWLAKITGASAAALSGELGPVSGPGDVHFAPYLSGERTPHNDSHVRGGFTGLDIGHDRAALTQAVMEGVAFALRDNLEALRGTGAKLDRLLAIGGGSRSRFWLETIAATLDLPLDLPAGGEFGAAFGAARLALVGDTGADPAAVMAPPEISETIEPDRALVSAYEQAYEAWRALYPVLKG